MSREPKRRKVGDLYEREETIGTLTLESGDVIRVRVCKDLVALLYTHRTVQTRIHLTGYEAGILHTILEAYKIEKEI